MGAGLSAPERPAAPAAAAAAAGTPRPQPQHPPRRRPLYLQDPVQPLLAQARELLEQLRLLPFIVVGSRAPVGLLQHLEDRRPNGQVEDDGRGQQGAPVHHGAGGSRGGAGGARRAGEPGRVPRAAAVGSQSPVVPLTPQPAPAVRRAAPAGFCRVPLESSTLPFHTPLPLSSPPPSSAPLRSTPPGPSPSPVFSPPSRAAI